MKKLLILVVLALLIVGLVFTIKNGFTISSLKVNSWKEITELNSNTDAAIQSATKLTEQDYKTSGQELKNAIQSLNKVKLNYESQMAYSEDGKVAGIVVKNHKIEHLWTTLGNYANDHNVDLSFDVSKVQTGTEIELYNLEFTILGSYPDTIDFLSDIIKDDTLEFEISKFSMVPNDTTIQKTTSDNTSQDTNTSTVTDSNANETIKQNTTTDSSSGSVDYLILKTTFNVQNVGIEFE